MEDAAVEPDAETVDACRRQVIAVFPKVCREHLDKLALQFDYDPDAVINSIVDAEESGNRYPRQQITADLKRKRSDAHDEAEVLDRVRRRMDDAINRHPNELHHPHDELRKRLERQLLRADFPTIPEVIIDTALASGKKQLQLAYIALYQKLAERGGHVWVQADADAILKQSAAPEIDSQRILSELRDARRMVELRRQNANPASVQGQQEYENFQRAIAEGLIQECECCCTDFALNRLAQCSADKAHFFCYECCRRQAETLIGLSKYELTCMSTGGCQATFSHSERTKFLDDKLTLGLDRIEQESMLQLANLEGLVSCPFCPFAAECTSVEVDREFRCLNPSCQITSCRLCKRETHIPKSCEEMDKEEGCSARRAIEEAMSSAMIRKCNKCGTPFIKEDGCNKMTCSRSSCRNVQCYVCSKSCDYSHFNDPARGGQRGNCPLFDNAETRHAKEIRKAEEVARKKVVDENPEIDPEDLEFHMSDQVTRDEKLKQAAKKQAAPAARVGPVRMVALPNAPVGLLAMQARNAEEFRQALQARNRAHHEQAQRRVAREYHRRANGNLMAADMPAGIPRGNQIGGRPKAPKEVAPAGPRDGPAVRNKAQAARPPVQARPVHPGNGSPQGRRPLPRHGVVYDPAIPQMPPSVAEAYAHAMIRSPPGPRTEHRQGPLAPYPDGHAQMAPHNFFAAAAAGGMFAPLGVPVAAPGLAPHAAVYAAAGGAFVVPGQPQQPGASPNRDVPWSPVRFADQQPVRMSPFGPVPNQQPGHVAPRRPPIGDFIGDQWVYPHWQ